MEPIQLTLPEPPITNTMYRNFRGHMVKNPKVREYQNHVKMICIEKNIEPFLGDVGVDFKWFAGRKSDLDNRMKAVFDALQGHAYLNDSQIAVINAKRLPKYNSRPRLELTIYPVEVV